MKKDYQKSAENKLIRSFGRIKSRKLSDHKNSLLTHSLPKYELRDEFFAIHSDYKKKSFEIGFGFGDFIFNKAKKNSEQLFLGCEPHINGVVSLLGYLEENPLNNVKISAVDCRILLENCPEKYFDEIYILFPDPWPKLKHFKRRLINIDFLDNFLASKMKDDSRLIIATDHDSYKTWILSEALKSKKFLWQAKTKSDWQNFPADWIETKYQKKAKREGRQSCYFEFKKR